MYFDDDLGIFVIFTNEFVILSQWSNFEEEFGCRVLHAILKVSFTTPMLMKYTKIFLEGKK